MLFFCWCFLVWRPPGVGLNTKLPCLQQAHTLQLENIFWLNLRKLNSPSVPVSGKSLEIMINYLEGVGPHKLREEVVVVVDSFTSAEQFEKDQQQGKLRRVSPEELDHALVLHIADQIRFGADEDTLQYFN